MSTGQMVGQANPAYVASLSNAASASASAAAASVDSLQVITPTGGTITKSIQQWIAYLAPWLTSPSFLFDAIGSFLTGAVVGENEETITAARTSTASYVNAAGTLVFAPANEIRVDRLGLVMEPAATSLVTQPNNLTGAPWIAAGVGVAAPTRTANTTDVLAPDGTNTATKLVFPAVSTVGHNSSVYINPTVVAGVYELSFWARCSVGAGAAPPVINFGGVNNALTTWTANTVQANDRQWTRHSIRIPTTASGWYFSIGCNLATGSGQVATAGGTIYVWGVDCKPVPFLTSTVGTVARTDDVASVSATPMGANAGGGSVWVRPQWSASGVVSDRTILQATGFSLAFIASTSVWRLTVGGQVVDSAAQTFAAYTDHQIRWRYDTTDKVRLTVDQQTEVVSSGAPASLSPGASLYLGNNGSAGAGVFLRRLILYPDSTQPAVSTPTPVQRVATLGDSIVYGYNVTTGWSSVLAGLLGSPWDVSNFGVNGDVAANMLTRWRSSIRGMGYGYLVLAGGINDIRVGTSAATVWASLKPIVDEAKADGLAVVLCTVTPFKNYSGQWTAGKQTELDSLNSTIRAYASSEALRLVDSYEAMEDPAIPYQWLPAYDQGDNLHPNQAGNNALAALVKVQVP